MKLSFDTHNLAGKGKLLAGQISGNPTDTETTTPISFVYEDATSANSSSTTSNTAGQLTFTPDEIRLGNGTSHTKYQSININLIDNNMFNPVKAYYPADLWDNVTIDNIGNRYMRTIIANNPTKFIRVLTKHENHLHFGLLITKENYTSLNSTEQDQVYKWFNRYPALESIYQGTPTTPLPTNNKPLKYSGKYDISFKTNTICTLGQLKAMLPTNSQLKFSDLFTSYIAVGNDTESNLSMEGGQGGEAPESYWIDFFADVGSATMADSDIYKMIGRMNGININKENQRIGAVISYTGLSKTWIPNNIATYGAAIDVEIICREWIPNS